MEKPTLKHVDTTEILSIINKQIARNRLRLKTDMGRDNNQFVAGEAEGLEKLYMQLMKLEYDRSWLSIVEKM
jgi:hypothetical protein